MSITWDDIARDMALEDLHHEAVMKRATREQCIFLFVEGECEANTIPGLLFDDGGSFEESFSIEEFLDAVFHENVMPRQIRSQFREFRATFDSFRPWFRQVQKFCAHRGFPKIREKKVEVAELLATISMNNPRPTLRLPNSSVKSGLSIPSNTRMM